VSGYLSAPAAGAQCLTWWTPITDPDLELPNQPSFSPPRIVTYEAPVGSGAWQTAVLASETDPALDQAGILHAFDVDSGDRLWTYLTSTAGNDGGDGLMGVVPAQHPQFPEMLFLAHGSVIAVINASGCPLGGFFNPCAPDLLWDSSTVPGADGKLVSSVALHPDGSAAFVHSASGALWRVNVSLFPTAIAFAWACTYKDPGACAPISENAERFVSGGFYRPTTAAQRDELRAAIADAHGARFGAAAGAAAPGEGAAARAARLARELPPRELFGLTTPSGYGAGRKGAGGACDVIDAAAFPLATPALYWSYLDPANPSTARDFRVAIVNYDAGADSALVVADDGGGAPIFSVASVTLADASGGSRTFAFGKSRSSPAFDRQGHVYAAMDLDFNGSAGADTLPAVIAVDS